MSGPGPGDVPRRLQWLGAALVFVGLGLFLSSCTRMLATSDLLGPWLSEVLGPSTMGLGFGLLSVGLSLEGLHTVPGMETANLDRDQRRDVRTGGVVSLAAGLVGIGAPIAGPTVFLLTGIRSGGPGVISSAVPIVGSVVLVAVVFAEADGLIADDAGDSDPVARVVGTLVARCNDPHRPIYRAVLLGIGLLVGVTGAVVLAIELVDSAPAWGVAVPLRLVWLGVSLAALAVALAGPPSRVRLLNVEMAALPRTLVLVGACLAVVCNPLVLSSAVDGAVTAEWIDGLRRLVLVLLVAGFLWAVGSAVADRLTPPVYTDGRKSDGFSAVSSRSG